MSQMPDNREESYVEIPANTQQDLNRALRTLQQSHPEWFEKPQVWSSDWARRFVLKPEAGAFVAAAILAALER